MNPIQPPPQEFTPAPVPEVSDLIRVDQWLAHYELHRQFISNSINWGVDQSDVRQLFEAMHGRGAINKKLEETIGYFGNLCAGTHSGIFVEMGEWHDWLNSQQDAIQAVRYDLLDSPNPDLNQVLVARDFFPNESEFKESLIIAVMAFKNLNFTKDDVARFCQRAKRPDAFQRILIDLLAQVDSAEA